jgi:hypothetical protein
VTAEIAQKSNRQTLMERRYNALFSTGPRPSSYPRIIPPLRCIPPDRDYISSLMARCPMMINGPSQEQIRARAFQLYLERGRQPDHELEDWLQAEFELTHLPFHVAHLEPLSRRRTLSLRQRRPLSVRFSKH